MTNLRHLLTTLEQIGHGLNLDLLGLLDWLKDRREQRDTTDTDLQPVEAGRPKVKIMTIHASKGLEFPIVFLAGGFTQAPVGKGQTIYRDDQGRVVFDLSENSEAQERITAERLSEQRRLLYVALTRPIFKLYVAKIKKPTRGSQFLGPLGSILLPALDQACPDKCGDQIAQVITPALAVNVPKPHVEPAAIPAKPPFHIDGPLFPAVDPNLGRRRIVTRSFSSMTKHHLSHVGEGSSFGDQTPVAEDEAVAGRSRRPAARPRVRRYGPQRPGRNRFRRSPSRPTPDDSLPGRHSRTQADGRTDQEKHGTAAHARRSTSSKQACRQQIASLVWHALKTPLG